MVTSEAAHNSGRLSMTGGGRWRSPPGEHRFDGRRVPAPDIHCTNEGGLRCDGCRRCLGRGGQRPGAAGRGCVDPARHFVRLDERDDDRTGRSPRSRTLRLSIHLEIPTK
jgi:hypothetical protein